MKKIDPSRRKTLKALGLGGGLGAAGFSLPEKWARPVVEAVVLPVHAQASNVSGHFVDSGVVLVADAAPSLLDVLVPKANAWSYDSADVCMDIVNGIANIFFVGSGSTIVYGKLNVPVPFGYIDLDFQPDCNPEPKKFAINGQFQQVNGQTCVVGNVRLDNRKDCGLSSNYFYVPYVAKPAGGSCGYNISPPQIPGP